MPVKHCCYGCCKSDSRYPQRMIGLHFIPFPKPKSQRDKCIRWIEACGRPYVQFNVSCVNKDTYICSKHFKDPSGPTLEYPDPVTYDKIAVRRTRRPAKRKKSNEHINESEKSQLVISVDSNNKLTQTENERGHSLDILAACAKITQLEDENKKLKIKLEEVCKELKEYKNA